MKNYFKNVTSFEDLKAQYKVLLKANHPDNGGELEAMQEINCEYDALFKIWKDKAINDNTLKEEEKEETAAGTRKKFYTAYGWEGSRYDSNLSIKEIAKSVRIYVKKKYPTCKFSVRTEHASMCREIIMEIKEFPEKMYKTGDDLRKEKIDWNADEIRDLMSKLRNHGFYDMGSFTQEDFVKEYETACKESSFYALKTDYFKAVLEDVNAFVKVTKHLLDLWGKEFAEVKAIAEMNDRKLPIQKIGMSDIIPCEEDMFFEVNNGRGNGAIIAYLFEDELKKLAKEHGGLYVSFSSIDTLMIFPNDRIPCGDKEIILKELTEVVLQANDEMPENLLGTKAYYFDPEHGFEF